MAFRNGIATCRLCDQSAPAPAGDFPTILDADCPAAAAVGDVVRYTADPIAGIHQVGLVDITDPSKTYGKGLVIAKSSSTRCQIQSNGLATLSGLTTDTLYFVGTDSKLSSTPPSPTGSSRAYTQEVGWAVSPSQLFIRFSSLRSKRGPTA